MRTTLLSAKESFSPVLTSPVWMPMIAQTDGQGERMSGTQQVGGLLALLLLVMGCDTHVDSVRDPLTHRNMPYKRDVFLQEAAAGNTTVVARFLTAGMDPDTRSRGRKTALWRAAESGHLATVCVLLNTGAHVNVRDAWGITPLMKAADNGHTAIVQILLAKGANLQARDLLGRAALQRAAAKGHRDTVQVLREAGAPG